MHEKTGDVELAGIVKWYGKVAAVKGIDLSIASGEMVSFLGPSGCGKTTTLRMIAGLESPDEGQVRIRGKAMNDVPTHRRNIGMVFQNYALFPHMTVYDNIAFGLAMRKESKADIQRKVTDVMQLIRLEKMADRLPSQLSGGQRQRIALARAIVTKPSVLLLDEPLGALDKKLREQMQVEIRMLQREVGITTIFVTHDQEEALTLSDRIVVMEGGRIVQVGTPEEIYRHPANTFVSDFIGMSNTAHARVERTEGRWAHVALQDGTRIVASANAHTQEGSALELSVRPENIVLGLAETEGFNVLQAQVSHVVYTGAITYCHLATGQGMRFIALVPNTASGPAASLPEIGTTVSFGWRHECGRLLPTAMH